MLLSALRRASHSNSFESKTDPLLSTCVAVLYRSFTLFFTGQNAKDQGLAAAVDPEPSHKIIGDDLEKHFGGLKKISYFLLHYFIFQLKVLSKIGIQRKL